MECGGAANVRSGPTSSLHAWQQTTSPLRFGEAPEAGQRGFIEGWTTRICAKGALEQ
jgi:hypothetical protein